MANEGTTRKHDHRARLPSEKLKLIDGNSNRINIIISASGVCDKKKTLWVAILGQYF